jgi:KTSC domain
MIKRGTSKIMIKTISVLLFASAITAMSTALLLTAWPVGVTPADARAERPPSTHPALKPPPGEHPPIGTVEDRDGQKMQWDGENWVEPKQWQGPPPKQKSKPRQDKGEKQIKYSGPVDLASVDLASFTCVDRDSWIKRVCFDASSQHMLINMNGIFYDYCGVDDGTIEALLAAPSMGKFYHAKIRGRFDCRASHAPSD